MRGRSRGGIVMKAGAGKLPVAGTFRRIRPKVVAWTVHVLAVPATMAGVDQAANWNRLDGMMRRVADDGD